ncbi:MAG: 50S ribosomal protein L25 [Candidatus Omnitrophota bacterium]|jgi:large subunit ribosomal protein L25|nr:50S ribosomal protein L25 [Candidatus Omnitrophota bacterium]
MEKAILKAETREGSGKKNAKDIRNKDLVPAVVYKDGKDALKLQLVAADLVKILHTKAGENVVVTLNITGGDSKIKDKTVVIKEIQREPIKGKMLHVDFNEISLTETLKVDVPLAAHGEPEGKKDGGTLEHVMWELQVECLPTNIPEKIEVDVSKLKIGEAIFVKNIVVPEGVKVLTDPELIAMIVKPPKVEVPKEEAPEAASEPELIRKKKEAEEEGAEDAKKEEASKAPEKKEEKK